LQDVTDGTLLNKMGDFEGDRRFKDQHFAHLRQECHNSKFGIFWVIGIERNFCRCTFKRYSVITQFAKLAAGEQLCRRCTHRKL